MRKGSKMDYFLVGILIILMLINILVVFKVVSISNGVINLMLTFTLLVCTLITYRNGYKKTAYFMIFATCFNGVISIIQLFS